MAALWSAAMPTLNNRLKLSGNAHHRGWADIDRRRKSDWPQIQKTLFESCRTNSLAITSNTHLRYKNLTTSGSLATIYAIMLAKAYTDRDIVMKIGGGFLPADMEYIRTARELTHRHGAALILDEVISGFRI